MFPRFVLVLVMAASFVGSSRANQVPPPVNKASEIIDVLFDHRVRLPQNVNVNEMSLMEVLTLLNRLHGITFVVNEEAFRDAGISELRDKRLFIAATNLNGLSVHQFLVRVLKSLSAVYLIKDGVVEVVPTGSPAAGPGGVKEPRLCAIVKNESLATVVHLLAERYDLSVTITPQAGEAAAKPVSGRILNLPADKALELLAVQLDLRIVREGSAFVIATREQAKTLLAERLEKERDKLELEKLKESGVKSIVPLSTRLDPTLVPKVQNVPNTPER